MIGQCFQEASAPLFVLHEKFCYAVSAIISLMKAFFSSTYRTIDWSLMVLVALLLVVGVMAIYSSTFRISNEEVTLLRYQRQLIFIGLGTVLGTVLWFINYRVLKQFVPYLFIFQIILLVAVLLFGSEVNGAKAWFRFGSFGLQPVEFVKAITVLVLAKYFSEHYHEMDRFRHVFISGIYVGIPLLLVLMQPDLGSALVLIAVWMGMLFVSNVRLRDFFLVIGFAALVLVGSWFGLLKEYQKARRM